MYTLITATTTDIPSIPTRPTICATVTIAPPTMTASQITALATPVRTHLATTTFPATTTTQT